MRDVRTEIHKTFPFGLKGPFLGVEIRQPSTDKALVRYKPNPKQLLLHNCMADEIFFGGSVFGGKSYALCWHIGLHSWMSPHARSIILRRTYDELKKSVIDQFRLLFEHPSIGRYLESKFIFEWNNGAVTFFRHCEDEATLERQHGPGYTLVVFDEVTTFTEKMFTTFYLRLRSSKDPNLKCQVLAASNPYGVGHQWVYNRWIKGKEPFQVYEDVVELFLGGKTVKHTVNSVFIPSFAMDNVAGMANDPTYLHRMKANLTPEAFESYVMGNWERFLGAAFPDFDEAVHVVKPYKIPESWKCIRALDWGYSSPFACIWLCQNPETGQIIVADEWYGARRSMQGSTTGLQMSAADFKVALMSREGAAVQAGYYPKPRYGEADPSMWQRRGEGMSSADQINAGTVLFRKAETDRVAGKLALHGKLRYDPETGQPGLVVFSHCKDTIGQMRTLVLDQRDPEDVDTRQDDHIYDALRYGVASLVHSPARIQVPYTYHVHQQGRRPAFI